MRSRQKDIAAFNDNTANLAIQFYELKQLRERLRQAQQSAQRSRPPHRRKRMRMAHSAHPSRRIADRMMAAQ
jgi:hypothetical protein